MDLVSNIDLSEILHEILTDICETICCFPHNIWPSTGAGGGPIQQQQVPFNRTTRMSYHPQIICLQRVSSAAGRRKPAAGSRDNRDYSMYQEIGDCQILFSPLWICSGAESSYWQHLSRKQITWDVRVRSHLRFIRREHFSPRYLKKWGSQPIIALFSQRKSWPNSNVST